MRSDPQRLSFSIDARDGAARAGVIQTPHGPIETPAFIPLATKGSVRGLDTDEVAGLGYQLILGNTYHLFDSPGPERIAAAGDLHGFMNWDRALITDSGGFQVFSLAHGGVANEVKGSGRKGDHGSEVEITEEGARFRSPRDGRELFLSPEVSMRIQAELGADIALAFDECTPFHADRDYTARSTERTHRWLDRCVAWHEENGPPGQALFGIVQGGGELLTASALAVGLAVGLLSSAIPFALGRDPGPDLGHVHGAGLADQVLQGGLGQRARLGEQHYLVLDHHQGRDRANVEHRRHARVLVDVDLADLRLASELGRELYQRLSTMGGHLDKLGRSLNAAVDGFNSAVGTLEGRVLVSARRLADLSVVDRRTDGSLPEPAQILTGTRTLSSEELLRQVP